MLSKNRTNSRSKGTLVLLLVLAASISAVAEPLKPIKAEGLPHCFEVNEHLYRGGQPENTGIVFLAKQGVRTVINLRDVRETKPDEKQAVQLAGMKYIAVPMRGIGAPTATQISQVLLLLNDQANWPVFVHCRRGKDRTGTVVACYRMAHDHWTNAQALEEAREEGLSSMERGMKHFILRFHPDVQTGMILPAP